MEDDDLTLLSGLKALDRINKIYKILRSEQEFRTWPHKFA